MEINKTLISIIGTVTTLMTFFSALVKVLEITGLRKPRDVQPPSNSPSRKRKGKARRAQGRSPVASPPSEDSATGGSTISRLIRSRTFVASVLLFILGVGSISYLYLIYRPNQLTIEITEPKSGKLDVKSDDEGSGLYPVKGNYTGSDLGGKNLTIYVLVRSENENVSSDEPWYVQPGNVETEDSWYWNGRWQLKEANVGRGEKKNPLTPGEKWEIIAVIAPKLDSRLYPELTRGITPSDLDVKLHPQAKSEISHVVINNIK